MVYATGDVPVGAYNSSRLANLGIGHGAFDAGAGYTYFNPQTGHELSGVLGFTANFINPSTQYQNGVDMHFDWGASQFLTKQVQVGLVGYAYKDIGCDSGSGDLRGLLPVPGFGRRPADRLHFSDRRHAGLSQSEGLRRIRRVGSADRLECVAYAFDLAAGAYAARVDAPPHHQVALAAARATQIASRDVPGPRSIVAVNRRRDALGFCAARQVLGISEPFRTA